jgi:aspartate/methionine/tyrosine aminotransferase
MKTDPFLIERFMDTHETHAELNLAESCVAPFTLHEFLHLTGHEGFFDTLQDLPLTYGAIEGSRDLRHGLARFYDHLDPANILLTGGAIGANFLAFYTLVEPGDTVISIFPTYQQLYSVPRSLGAHVKLLPLREEDRWLPDPDALAALIDQKTKLIVINNPHNPTGSLIDTEALTTICHMAEDAHALLLCDETYRGLYVHPDDTVPSVVDLSDTAIATGSFSKTFSLAGLRLGWIAAPCSLLDACKAHRDYTTISNGVIDDALATLAVQHADRILHRNLTLLRTNHQLLAHWIADEPHLRWVPPRAGSVAFLKHDLPLSSDALCLRLLQATGTLLVPGSCFDLDQYVRIGYGCPTATLERGLARFKQFLAAFQ